MFDKLRLNAFPSVAASAISTLVTDELVDRSLHGLMFERGGGAFTNAHIDNIRVRLDYRKLEYRRPFRSKLCRRPRSASFQTSGRSLPSRSGRSLPSRLTLTLVRW